MPLELSPAWADSAQRHVPPSDGVNASRVTQEPQRGPHPLPAWNPRIHQRLLLASPLGQWETEIPAWCHPLGAFIARCTLGKINSEARFFRGLLVDSEWGAQASGASPQQHPWVGRELPGVASCGCPIESTADPPLLSSFSPPVSGLGAFLLLPQAPWLSAAGRVNRSALVYTAPSFSLLSGAWFSPPLLRAGHARVPGLYTESLSPREAPTTLLSSAVPTGGQGHDLWRVWALKLEKRGTSDSSVSLWSQVCTLRRDQPPWCTVRLPRCGTARRHRHAMGPLGSRSLGLREKKRLARGRAPTLAPRRVAPRCL